MRAGIFNTTIKSIKDLGVQNTRHFHLAFEPGVEFDFEPGQFLNIMLPTGEKTLKRPYSIASPPVWKGGLDLCWKKVEHGTATNLLWELKEGDTLQIQGPLGRFILKRPLPKRIVFVSTGTGIAPFRAMIHQLLEKEQASSEVWNFFGNRYEVDILYREEFEALEQKYSNFRNIFTVSRPKAPETWKGETVYVQHLLKKHLPDAENSHLYICGLKAMINEVEKAAFELGFTKDQILYEKYD